MEQEYRDNINTMKQILVFKLDGCKNKMQVIRGFKQVSDHFGITGIIYNGIPRSVDEDEKRRRAA